MQHLRVSVNNMKYAFSYTLLIFASIILIGSVQILFDVHNISILLREMNNVIIYDGTKPILLTTKYIFMDNSFDFYLTENNYQVTSFMYNIIYKISASAFIVSIIQFIIYIKYVSRLRLSQLLDTNLHANEINDKYTQILSDNLNHEINTPLAIIQGNIQYLNNYMNECDVIKSNVRKHLNAKFNVIEKSVYAIYSVLDILNNNKKIRYSSNEFDLYQILQYSAQIVRSNRVILSIDENFKNYSLTYMHNGEFMNVVTNLIKNSIEAGADVIKVSCKTTSEYLHVYIIDNGVGFRDLNNNIIHKTKYNSIFEPYVSTKLIENEGFINKLFMNTSKLYTTKLRGVGLYLSKMAVLKGMGQMELIETSENGSVFKLSLHYKHFDNPVDNTHPEFNLNNF